MKERLCVRGISLKLMLLCIALAAFCLAGCSNGQPAQTSSSEPVEEQVTVEQMKEIFDEAVKVDYKSVTGDIAMSIDADQSQASEADQEMLAAFEASNMQGIVKIDMAAEPPVAYIKYDAQSLGGEFEIFLTDDEVVYKDVTGIKRGKPEDFGFPDGFDMETLLFQGTVNQDALLDCFTDIVKTVEGDQTVYTANVDKEKFVKLAYAGSDLETMAQEIVESDVPMVVVYKVGPDGRLSSVDMSFGFSGIMCSISSKLYDYDATTVPEIPTE